MRGTLFGVHTRPLGEQPSEHQLIVATRTFSGVSFWPEQAEDHQSDAQVRSAIRQTQQIGSMFGVESVVLLPGHGSVQRSDLDPVPISPNSSRQTCWSASPALECEAGP
jgi:hypothetical protein